MTMEAIDETFGKNQSQCKHNTHAQLPSKLKPITYRKTNHCKPPALDANRKRLLKHNEKPKANAPCTYQSSHRTCIQATLKKKKNFLVYS